jgi:hypothetical protein
VSGICQLEFLSGTLAFFERKTSKKLTSKKAKELEETQVGGCQRPIFGSNYQFFKEIFQLFEIS